ncbi:MAG: hypothetical protein KJ729_05305, partial [Euryarchaeota archaeon]|nr:hypothetical protein [Euryarchaeota archaeon]
DGDIEDLENYWKVYPSLKNVLFAESPGAGYSKLKIPQEEIKNDADASEEMKVLEGYLKLIEKEADANKKIKDAQTALDKKVIARYKELTEDEVKILVVDDKWMAAISRDVKTELERISQRLTQRIKELAERYATPMPELNTMVDGLEAKVNKHLEKMGFVWK